MRMRRTLKYASATTHLSAECFLYVRQHLEPFPFAVRGEPIALLLSRIFDEYFDVSSAQRLVVLRQTLLRLPIVGEAQIGLPSCSPVSSLFHHDVLRSDVEFAKESSDVIPRCIEWKASQSDPHSSRDRLVFVDGCLLLRVSPLCTVVRTRTGLISAGGHR